ncbi:MAG: hypothetical protein Q4A78_04130 [Peptostreptococcaceae bacterium]|nr:hypothetical protein [Peptostreptococcaceae bacterium]
MNRQLKRWFRVFLFGGIIGVLATMLRKNFFPQVTDQDFLRMYFIFAPIFIFGVLMINLFFARKKYRALNALTPLAKTEPKRYIEEAEKQLQIIKNPSVREIAKINIGAAYCNLEDYESAREIMENIDTRRLHIQNLFVYQLDLAYVYFNLGEEEKGIEVYEEFSGKILPMTKKIASKELNALLKINEVYYRAAKKDVEKAEQVYLKSKELLMSAKEQKDIDKLEKRLKSLREQKEQV